MNASSLLSGLLGAIIGALTTWFASRDSIEKTFVKSLELDDKKRKRDEEQNIKLAQSSLLAEVEENLGSLKIWKRYRGKFRFNTFSWNTYKQFTKFFKPVIREKLIKAYSKIHRFNTLIDYDLQIPHGSGYNDEEIKRQAEDVEISLKELLKSLKEEN